MLVQLSSQILILKNSKISLSGNISNDNFIKSRVLIDKLVAMVTQDNLRNLGN